MRTRVIVGGTGAVTGKAARRAPATPGFSLDALPAPAARGPATAVVAPAAESFLALQTGGAELAGPATAAEHAEVMLGRLGDLQRAMVASDPAAQQAALGVLAAQLAKLPTPIADAGLAAILEGVALRVRIELARHGW